MIMRAHIKAVTGARVTSTCGAFLVLVTIAGCKSSGPVTEASLRAEETQSEISRVIDCDRLGAPVDFETHVSASLGRAAAPVGPLFNLRLHGLRTVSPLLVPGRHAKSENTFAGLVPFRIEASGTYTVLVASVAWADVVEADPPRVIQPRSFKWVTLCGKPFKSGLYTLESNKIYLVQLWDSPDRELNVMIRRLP